MDGSWKTFGKCAVAAVVATAFLTFAFVTAQPSEAGSPQAQDVAKVQVKIEVKKDMPAEAKAANKNVVEGRGVNKTVVEAKAVGKAVVEVRAAQVQLAMPAANVEAMTQQFIQNMRPMLGVELRLLSSACDPSPTQRREIAIEGGRALKEAAKKVAETQLGINQAARRGEYPDPRKMVRDAMEAAAKARLSPEQFSRYKKEMEARINDQKEVLILNMVASFDKLLFLSTEQREKLSASLQSNYDEKIYPSIENIVVYEAYYPLVPDQSITPILTEEQKKIWRGAQKINFASIRNFNFFNNGMVNVVGNEVEDEDEKAALADEVKK